MGDTDNKGEGRGRGEMTEAGVQKAQERRLAALEQFVSSKFPGEFTPETPAEEEQVNA